MRILAIETSCDETAVSLIEAKGPFGAMSFTILGNSLLSQIELHKEFGGVYPSLAKREHSKNLVPLLQNTLFEARMFEQTLSPLSKNEIGTLKELLSREPELFVLLIAFLSNVKKPDVDVIAVTHGPGLEPTLWVGINFAKALSSVWNIPLMPINHMEGHIVSAALKQLLENSPKPAEKIKGVKTIQHYALEDIDFPALALLISGGHTQLVLVRKWGAYEIVGETRDDAVGEAFDKVARMLELPYPGGPEISKLAESAREENLEHPYSLPRPMIDINDFNFSFSGLKTAALYLIRKKGTLNETDKKQIAREFENAVADVLLVKTKRAIDTYGIRTLLVGGGVSANKHVRYTLETHLKRTHLDIETYIPRKELTGDNAIMIAVAAYLRRMLKKGTPSIKTIVAQGNARI
ncbi:tRNA (adenosine(37)-N6)-threonylcarbamoyltransferase complex transferase subunit TsaD [Candidatus Kaiserbacteria bacterium]|nr:tRNA (adenosine(37)-N6)-threonylcarbamoyltransferase complex transferase subunit TsaD [Candidatus Kaiserbacteria bacterium]